MQESTTLLASIAGSPAHLTAAAYLGAPASHEHVSGFEGRPRWGLALWPADPTSEPPTDAVARSAWLWPLYQWDPDELRVITRRAGLQKAPRRVMHPSRPDVIPASRPLVGRRSGRRVLGATVLGILFALGAELAHSPASADGVPTTAATSIDATRTEPPSSASTRSSEAADRVTGTTNCAASSDRMLYVAALSECFPAEW